MITEKEYEALYKFSLEDPEGYWGEVAKEVDWFKKCDRIYDPTDPLTPKWFHGAELNICYNSLDRHVANGKGDKVVMYHRSSLTNKDRHITYNYLLTEVSKLAAVLANYGVKKGDAVVIYLPNIPEGVIAMQACARLGAIHCVLYGGSTPYELASRLDQTEAVVVITCVVGMFRDQLLNYQERINDSIDLCSRKPRKCIFLRREQKNVSLKEGRDIIWEEVIDKFGTHDCVPIDANHPAFYAYTSGTTGNPKAIVFEAGGTLVRYHAEYKYFASKDDIMLVSSELGWILGHTAICYFPLLMCFPTVLYEGDQTGENDTFYKLVQDFNVTSFCGSYSTLRAIKAKDPDGSVAARHDLSSIKRLTVGAECPDSNCMEFALRVFNAPIVNGWGQTEANMWLAAFHSREKYQEKKIYPYPKETLGIKLMVLRNDGTETAPGETGKLMVKLPLPPGCIVTFLKRHDAFLKEYLEQIPGFYDTKDEGRFMEGGGVTITGRSDDVINVGPFRVAGSNIEEVVLQHPEVVECIVIGVPDAVKGEAPLALFTAQKGTESNRNNIIKEVNDKVLEKLGESIFFRGSVCVQELPKTVNGKVQRRVVRELLHGKLETETHPQKNVLVEILHAVNSSGTVSV